jgi:predicted small lipoprotein YifL|uniref:Lipoprotein n=1 Tax=Colwellia sp. C1 TaxID=1737566 RepID=A0A0P0LXS8_9GAMM|nr:hypothetical protein [Colwellia sp. C1]
MHSIKHFSFFFICFLLSVFLSACGSQGDLYQVVEPEPEQNVRVEAPQEKNTDTTTDTIKKSK